MAAVIGGVVIDSDPAAAWSALSDFGALHERLVPGFVTDYRLDGADTRVITFFTGAVARERLVGIDDDARRLAYTVVDSSLNATHHNASAQVLDNGDARSRFVCITDLLPDEPSAPVAEVMDLGIATIKRTLDRQ